MVLIFSDADWCLQFFVVSDSRLQVKTARQQAASAERDATGARREAKEVQAALDDATDRVASLEEAGGMLSQTDTDRAAVMAELKRVLLDVGLISGPFLTRDSA